MALGGFTRSSGLMQVCNYGDYFFIVVTISCFNAVWEAAVRYRRGVTHRGAECLRGVLVQESFFIDPTVSLGPLHDNTLHLYPAMSMSVSQFIISAFVINEVKSPKSHHLIVSSS